MAKLAKFLQAAAGQAGGAALDITDVFSTYLYDGTSASKTITNGLDLGGEGGLVWIKKRNESANSDHMLYDTERGPNERLFSNDNGRSYTRTDQLNSFDSDGFTLGADSPASPNTLGKEYVSWSFRKAPKFFDVVTYTGNGTAGRQIAHNLGTTVGMLVVKRTDSAGDWSVFHRKLNGGTNSGNYRVELQSTVGESTTSHWNNTVPSSTHFTVGNSNTVNGNGNTYVAYLFAHNNSDGEFGPDSDKDIIKCGSYTGNGADARTIDLGFEAQWVLLKRSDGATDWWILDNMRGLLARPEASQYLEANTANAEAVTGQVFGDNQGFMVDAGDYNTSGENYIYMAIRRGPLAQPESGTEVFAVDAYSGNSTAGRTISSGFPVDLAIVQSRSAAGDTNAVADRLRGANLLFNTPTATAELTNNSDSITGFDLMDGIEIGTDTRVNWSSGTYVSWMWKRAPGYFDSVAYTGTGSARNLSHNLGVAPEMMWIKPRTLGYQWSVYHKDVSSSSPYYELILNDNGALTNNNNTNAPFAGNPTATTIPLPSGTASASNRSGYNYIAYLFATVPGVSKVGSYTGNAGTQTIDCGFTSGARFILIKRSSGSGVWAIWDTERGINVNEDPFLTLNTTDAESPGQDEIDAHASGFIINSPGGSGDAEINKSGSTYIFYAIA